MREAVVGAVLGGLLGFAGSFGLDWYKTRETQQRAAAQRRNSEVHVCADLSGIRTCWGRATLKKSKNERRRRHDSFLYEEPFVEKPVLTIAVYPDSGWKGTPRVFDLETQTERLDGFDVQVYASDFDKAHDEGSVWISYTAIGVPR